MRKIIILITFLILLFLPVIGISATQSLYNTETEGGVLISKDDNFSEEGLERVKVSEATINPLSEKCAERYKGDPRGLIYCFLGKTIKFLAWTVSILMVIMIIVSGFLFMTAGGNPDKVVTAKNALTAAIVGGVIALSSWALVIYVGNLLSVDIPSEIEITAPTGEISPPIEEIPTIPGEQLPESPENIEALATASYVIFPPVKNPDTGAVIKVTDPSAYFSCEEIKDRMKGYYPDASVWGEEEYTFYVKGIDVTTTDVQVFYKKQADSDPSKPIYDIFYDMWSWNSSVNGYERVNNKQKINIGTDYSKIKNGCPETTPTVVTPPPTLEAPTLGHKDIIVARIDKPYNPQNPEGLIVRLPPGWYWMTKLDQDDIQGIQDSYNKSETFHGARMLKNYNSVQLKRSVDVLDWRNTPPLGEHFTPEEVYKLLEESNAKQPEPHPISRIYVDGQPALKENHLSEIEGKTYTMVQIHVVYCDTIYQIWLDNKVPLDGPLEKEFDEWVSTLKFNYTCQPSSLTESPEKKSVMFSAYTIELDTGQTYSIDIVDGIPYVVDGDQRYEIKSEKFGTYAKIDKKSLAYKRRKGISIFPVGKKDATFGIVETDQLPFKYIEFDTHSPLELNGIVINANDNIIGEVLEDEYEIPKQELNFNNIRFRAEGDQAVNYLKNTEDMDKISKIINRLQNKYGKRIDSLILEPDDEINALYWETQIKLNTGLLKHIYEKNYKQRFSIFEAVITHEFGHFLDDVLCDGIADSTAFCSGYIPCHAPSDYSPPIYEFTGIFLNIFDLFAGVSEIANSYLSNPLYNTDPEFKKEADDIVKANQEIVSFVDYKFYDFPITPELKGGHPWDNEAELFATTFIIYSMYKTKFENYIATVSNSAIKNIMYVLYLTMRKLTEKKFPFPYDLEKFGRMTPEDIVTGDFQQYLTNISAKTEFTKPTIYGCENIKKYYKKYYPMDQYYLKGMDIQNNYLRIFYKRHQGIKAEIYYDEYRWISGEKTYKQRKRMIPIGHNHKAIINKCGIR